MSVFDPQKDIASLPRTVANAAEEEIHNRLLPLVPLLDRRDATLDLLNGRAGCPLEQRALLDLGSRRRV